MEMLNCSVHAFFILYTFALLNHPNTRSIFIFLLNILDFKYMYIMQWCGDWFANGDLKVVLKGCRYSLNFYMFIHGIL